MELYTKLFGVFQKQYLMYAMVGILVSSSLGGAAAMLVLHRGHGFLEMSLVTLLVAVCMGFNAMVLADRGPKVVFNSFLLSICVSTLISLIYILF